MCVAAVTQVSVFTCVKFFLRVADLQVDVLLVC